MEWHDPMNFIPDPNEWILLKLEDRQFNIHYRAKFFKGTSEERLREERKDGFFSGKKKVLSWSYIEYG